MITDRGLFIKQIIEYRNYKKYLEIGLSNNPRAPYRLLDNIEIKHSVDIGAETGADFIMNSDLFFENLKNGNFSLQKDYKWDAIFIDGDHNAEQVFKDLNNAFDHLTDDGIIFIHDILPSEYSRALEMQVANITLALCDAWKVVHYCLKHRPDMHVCSLEEGDPNPCGLAVILKNNNNNRIVLHPKQNLFYQFSQMSENKSKFMNVIDNKDIFKWIENPYYNYLNIK